MPSAYSQVPPEMYLFQAFFSSIWRPIEKMTSSAFNSRVGVKKSVVWNLTPLRSLKV
ncbi:hypothetical protein D3C73_573950 [compost metagenome]